MRLRTFFVSICALFFFSMAYAQDQKEERQVFIPKGDIGVGAQFASMNLDSDNTEWMLFFNPISAKGKISSIGPFVEYAYRNNRTAGVRINYTSGNASVDNITLDLLNEGMSLELSDVDAEMTALHATVFHRNYFGIDRLRRLGFVVEGGLTMGRGNTEFKPRDSDPTKSSYFRVKAYFSPGLVFYLMDNVSILGSISLANISYTKGDSYEDGVRIGGRDKFGAKAGIDLLGIWFGASIHF